MPLFIFVYYVIYMTFICLGLDLYVITFLSTFEVIVKAFQITRVKKTLYSVMQLICNYIISRLFHMPFFVSCLFYAFVYIHVSSLCCQHL